MKSNYRSGTAIVLVGFLWLALAIPAAARDAGKIIWEPSNDAQLKLEGHSLKTWNVWLAEKKKNLVLILLVRRYLLIDLKEQAVYQLMPNDLKPDGQNLESSDFSDEWKPIPTSDWTVRDVGPAELVRLTLGDYSKQLELQLPHMPDLRWGY